MTSQFPVTFPFEFSEDWYGRLEDLPAVSDLELLKRDLLSGDAITSSAAAEKLASQNSAVDQTWHVSVYDKLWVKIGELGDDMISLQGNDPRNKMPAAQLKIKGESQLIDTFMKCSSTHVGVVIETAGIRFAFYVDTFDYEFDNGAWVGTANLNGVWDILNYLVIWPNWWLPIQFQLFSHAVYIGPLCTVVESMISENALRIQAGLWEFVNNALSLNADVRAWFGTLLQSNGNIFDMLKTPIYVVRTNPFLDTSPLVARTVRMETCGTVIEDITRSYGVNTNVDLWLPGDDQPDYWTQTFPALALTQPTYVVSVKDRSQITGPTGTVIDSAVRQVVDVAGTFFEGILPFIDKVPGRDGVFIAPRLGVDHVEPWAVLIAPEPGQKGNVLTCRISFHTPKGWQHIIGGRSPKWLNDIMNATFAWIIDSISILLGFTGIPSNLLEGFLNNTILAFQMVQHYDRRDEVGPYHPGVEVMHATTSAPYNVETLFGFINALWESRGWVSVIATFRNAEVYTLGKDVFRGGLVSVLYMDRTRIFTDYIEEVTFQVDRNKRDILLQIGDGKAEESPLAKHQRFITGVLESINVLTLAPQS